MTAKPIHNKKQKGRNSNGLYIAACAVCAVIILVLLLVPPQKAQTAQFTPPPFDTAAVSGEPKVPEEKGWSEMQIRAGFGAYVCGALYEEDGRVAVWLYNKPDSDSWLKLRMLDADGNILGETGLLRPGEYVQYLNLDTIPTEDATVVLRLMGYAPETYYSAGSVGLETTLQIPQ